MKELIFEYLKRFNIQLEKYIYSDVDEFNVDIKSDKEISPHLKIMVRLEREENGCQIYLKNYPELGKKFVFDELTKGLIQLINDNSDRPVTESSFEKGWYGWETNDLAMNFGIKNEIFEFSARFAISNQ
jgi:hypothetical protein